MLLQDGKVIVDVARQLKSHEKNYPRHGLELAAIFFVLKIRRHYPYRNKFEIYTVHTSFEIFFHIERDKYAKMVGLTP